MKINDFKWTIYVKINGLKWTIYVKINNLKWTHSVYQPGKPGNLGEFFKPEILREISGNFKNSVEKWIVV